MFYAFAHSFSQYEKWAGRSGLITKPRTRQVGDDLEVLAEPEVVYLSSPEQLNGVENPRVIVVGPNPYGREDAKKYTAMFKSRNALVTDAYC